MIKLLIDVFLNFFYIPDWYKTQSMCCRVISEDLFVLVYFPNKYKTEKMCNESAADCLAALKFIPDWFVTSKMAEKCDNALYANDDILF